MRQTTSKTQDDLEISRDYVRKAFQEGHYVEAITLTHYALSNMMNETYLWAIGAITMYDRPSQLIPLGPRRHLPSKYNYPIITRILCDMGIYQEDTYTQLNQFNKWRNMFTHQLDAVIFSKDKKEECFNLGMALWDLVAKRGILWEKELDKRREIYLKEHPLNES